MIGNVIDGVSIVSYDNEKDYLDAIIDAVNDGSHYALAMAKIYEAQRNLKIEIEDLNIEPTNFFSLNNSPEEIAKAISKYITSAASPYELSDSERHIVEQTVMAEAMGESYEGQMAVAQAILDGALRNGFDVITSIRRYQIVTRYDIEASTSVKNAVAAVFDRGERVTENKMDLWYATWTYSSWHESQLYITTIGTHRFFWMNSNMN